MDILSLLSERLFNFLLNFVGDNFLVFIYFNAFIVIIFLGTILLVQANTIDIPKEKILEGIRSTFNMIVIMLFMLSQVVIVYFGYQFYRSKQTGELMPMAQSKKVEYPRDVLPNSRWVNDKSELYFISDNKLFSILLNGENKQKVFEAQSPIREYHFAPKGRNVLVVTDKNLALIDQNKEESKSIEEISSQTTSADINGAINNVRWAKQSDKFYYEISRWTPYSSQEKAYVYDLPKSFKNDIKSGGIKSNFLAWDDDGKSVYLMRKESKATSQGIYFVAHVYKVSLDDLHSELVDSIQLLKNVDPVVNLAARGINLYTGSDAFSFGRSYQRQIWESEKGDYVAMDKDDNLFYGQPGKKTRQLFKIPREKKIDITTNKEVPGDLTVKFIRWIPGGKYVVLEDKNLGIVILDPIKNKLGILDLHGNTIGWMPPASVY